MSEVTMSLCGRKNLCVDCNSKICYKAGDIGADCPKWQCDNDVLGDCDNCEFIKEYVEEVRSASEVTE